MVFGEKSDRGNIWYSQVNNPDINAVFSPDISSHLLHPYLLEGQTTAGFALWVSALMAATSPVLQMTGGGWVTYTTFLFLCLTVWSVQFSLKCFHFNRLGQGEQVGDHVIQVLELCGFRVTTGVCHVLFICRERTHGRICRDTFCSLFCSVFCVRT